MEELKENIEKVTKLTRDVERKQVKGEWLDWFEKHQEDGLLEFRVNFWQHLKSM